MLSVGIVRQKLPSLLRIALASYVTASCHSIWLAGPVLIYLGLMRLLPVRHACCACLLCMPACIAWHHPLYKTVLRPLVPPGTRGPTLDSPLCLEVGNTSLSDKEE